MKEIIRDPKIIGTINPNHVITYLQSQGWKEEKKISDIGAIWVLPNPSEPQEPYEVLIPLRPDFDDFALRMADVLANLSTVEDRSKLDIFDDINMISFDIIRIRINYTQSLEHSIPFDEGIKLFTFVKQLMFSIASSVEEPRSFFKGRRFQSVHNYLQRLKIGQTEPGSYIIKIISPIDDHHSSGISARKVTETLFKALDLTIKNEFSEIPELIEVVKQGISANFCESIIGMTESLGDQGLTFNLHSSKLIKFPSSIPAQQHITKDLLPKLKETKNQLKSPKITKHFEKRQPPKNAKNELDLIKPNEAETVKIEGYVIKLEKIGENPKVTIIAFLDQNLSQVEVVVNVNKHQYVKAFEANLDNRKVICEGQLTKYNDQFIIDHVRSFSIAKN